ncbi:MULTISPECIES: EamA family transporter [unclassified Gilliamella]|uniref:EamA family transporter n=1 Tax=unclassified Gilliamella TaxID=2685620 RepID=UPI001C6A61AC|nr:MULTISPECIES: EamA family transporter [unclassified Gilliamella]MCX8601833.1 EamA family transporter [Gilliamella sp. B3722]MCX8607973.1 EamA family transporter [Gilliamella sp. B3771]MCX8611092.1 EamA family transporter [Gilliamella sp. B3891]MCX8613567.1 EamA family transporter [Gilliamella sp. B3773]MCX8614445.1 EamA family transporter [Gilliamella sp. B3770]
MFKRSWPVLLIFISMISVQGSASIAKYLFPVLGPEGMTAWRLTFSSVMLAMIFKPWRKAITKQALRYIILYGLAMGCMNLSFYNAISRIPLGIAVAIELTGPIMVAMFSGRRLADFIWLGIAVVGLGMLLPIHQASSELDPIGIVMALTAGACWACYILFGRKAGAIHGSSSVALGAIIASILLFPIGVWQSGSAMFSISLLPLIFLVSLLASAIPYGLDMVALPRLPAQTFSTLMSLSPVFAAFSGLIVLHEQLTHYQWLAIGLIILSSIGTVLSMSRPTKIKSLKQQ